MRTKRHSRTCQTIALRDRWVDRRFRGTIKDCLLGQQFPRLVASAKQIDNSNYDQRRNGYLTISFRLKIQKLDSKNVYRLHGRTFHQKQRCCLLRSMLELILGATDNCALPTLCPIFVDTTYAISMI
ncbi:hypothetical protein [Brucella anthropi]|uniref:hypothetical protein n=1 Tax=Brucella anthropi TaxID=529 RepID=UPI0011BDA379|nr:hypothetical protein [Brucella anthropi]